MSECERVSTEWAAEVFRCPSVSCATIVQMRRARQRFTVVAKWSPVIDTFRSMWSTMLLEAFLQIFVLMPALGRLSVCCANIFEMRRANQPVVVVAWGLLVIDAFRARWSSVHLKSFLRIFILLRFWLWWLELQRLERLGLLFTFFKFSLLLRSLLLLLKRSLTR